MRRCDDDIAGRNAGLLGSSPANFARQIGGNANQIANYQCACRFTFAKNDGFSLQGIVDTFRQSFVIECSSI